MRLAIEAHNVYVLLATVSKPLSYLHFLKFKLWTDACIQFACRDNVKILHKLLCAFSKCNCFDDLKQLLLVEYRQFCKVRNNYEV